MKNIRDKLYEICMQHVVSTFHLNWKVSLPIFHGCHVLQRPEVIKCAAYLDLYNELTLNNKGFVTGHDKPL